MTDPSVQRKSLPEQIIEATLSRLQKSDAYDQVVLDKLKEVVAKGKLTSVRAVIAALGGSQE